MGGHLSVKHNSIDRTW